MLVQGVFIIVNKSFAANFAHYLEAGSLSKALITLKRAFFHKPMERFDFLI
jgi:hypothetical protein